MFLRVSPCGHHKIINRTVDINVVVLAFSLAQTFQPTHILWIAFGTKKLLLHLAVHKVATGLGPESISTSNVPLSDSVQFSKPLKEDWNVFPEFTEHYWSCNLHPVTYLKRSWSPLMCISNFPSLCMRIVYKTSTWANIKKKLARNFLQGRTTWNRFLQAMQLWRCTLSRQSTREVMYMFPAPELPTATSWEWTKSQ
jgi:hypothetical protein